jgi:amino acid adenylation domain-containing protein
MSGDYACRMGHCSTGDAGPGNAVTTPDPEATVADLVEAQAARTPQAPAVESRAGALNYAELDGRANRIARVLQGLGVGRDVRVAVFAERSLEMTVGLLAILKAGGACVPIDPSSPPERAAYMLADSGAMVVLTQEQLAARLPAGGGAVIRLEDDWEDTASSPPRLLAPGDLGYVIYTSGSTGQPKGVMLEHRGLVNHHRAVAQLYRLRPGDRVLQFCSMNFDVSVEEIFPTWASGATVVLRDDALPILGRAWLQWLRQARVTVLNLPTAYWHEWVRDLDALVEQVPEEVRLVIVGGEKAHGGAYRLWLRVGGDRVRWVNAYGPTEASILATFFEPDPTAPAGGADWDDPPIGGPLDNTTVHVLAPDGSPAPPGVAGELHLGGVGLARGYLNQPEMTAEKFLPDPWGAHRDARLYRTGDVVRARRDGNLEFLGRLDQQVKVRGFRIECGEVEAALRAHPQVADAVVVAREDRSGGGRLVGYVVPRPDAELAGAALRRFLSGRLPLFMVPAAFVVLPEFPTSTNGKVDRAALPAPECALRPPSAAGTPRTPIEEVLSNIWAQVLGLDAVGVEDNFFDLGGHSLMATQVIAQARETFGVELAVHSIFEAPTIRALAARLDRGGGDGVAISPLVAVPRQDGAPLPLSIAQEQMWALEVQATPPGLYNVTVQRHYTEAVDCGVLRQALDYLVLRHETLRTEFRSESGGIFQTITRPGSVALAVTDLRSVPESERPEQLRRHIAAQDAQPFELDRAPLFRPHLYCVGDDESVLVTTFDHLISDGTSAFIYLTELDDAYRALVRGSAPELPPMPVQFADFALWQRRWLTEERQQAQLEYWQRTLGGMPQGPALPFDCTPTEPTRRIGSRQVALPEGAYEGLRRVARSTHSTTFIVATAAFASVLAALGHTTDIVLSTTLSGRQRVELEGIIGYFAGIGRIRTDLGGGPTFEQIVHRTCDAVLGLFGHQDVPFMRVRQAVLPGFRSGADGGRPSVALPVEFQYFHAGQDRWAPGMALVERPDPGIGVGELFFRGQLHPLSVTLLDDGSQLWGEVNYKTDFYREATIDRVGGGLERLLAEVASSPDRPFSELAALVEGLDPGRYHRPHRPIGTWQLDQ